MRGEVAGIDGADARSGQDVDLRRPPAHASDVVEDVREDADLVGATSPAAREDHRDAPRLRGHGHRHAPPLSPEGARTRYLRRSDALASGGLDEEHESPTSLRRLRDRCRVEQSRYEGPLRERVPGVADRGWSAMWSDFVVIDRALRRQRGLGRPRALQGVATAQHADLEAVLAPL